MRLPRQDTPLRLPAEQPRLAIAADEALLDTAFRAGQSRGEGRCLVATSPKEPGAERSDRAWRWWLPSSGAVVVGLALHHRLAEVVDLALCQAAGVEVVERRAGGGALLLDSANMLCGAIAVPTSEISGDITESYRWLGNHLIQALSTVGIEARLVDVAEARDAVAQLRDAGSPLRNTCFGALSPYEVLVENRKLVGLAQVRRRDVALFQLGILLEDQSRLADYLKLPDDPTRETLRQQLKARTVGLAELNPIPPGQPVVEVAAAIADAMPCAP